MNSKRHWKIHMELENCLKSCRRKEKKKEEEEEIEEKAAHVVYESEIRRTGSAATLAYLWINMHVFWKATGNLETNKTLKKAFTLCCLHNEFIQRHPASVHVIMLALVHIQHQNTARGTVCDECDTWASLYVVHDIRAAAHSGGPRAEEANWGERGVNEAEAQCAEWAGTEIRQDPVFISFHFWAKFYLLYTKKNHFWKAASAAIKHGALSCMVTCLLFFFCCCCFFSHKRWQVNYVFL